MKITTQNFCHKVKVIFKEIYIYVKKIFLASINCFYYYLYIYDIILGVKIIE